MTDFDPNYIVAVGTQVVTHLDITLQNGSVVFARGAVGVIVKSPVDNTHNYRVRFMDDTEVALSRSQFTVRKHYQNPTEPATSYNLYDYVLYKAVIGSRAMASITKARMWTSAVFYLPPADLHWALYGVPDQLENEATQKAS
ncbi:MAG: hypothetical protein U0694_22950 [Anaerolineae bacterium]